jgi:hypothetical protein
MRDIEDAPVRDRVGFNRAEMNTERLAGTVKFHETHLFVCSELTSSKWKSNTEKEADSGHALLSQAVAASSLGAAKVTLFEAATEADVPGSVLAFPRAGGLPFRVTPAASMLLDAPAWAAEVLAGVLSAAAPPETATHVFVCAHARRDARCGATGPVLVSELRAALAVRAAAGDPRPVEVRACSHVGGHAYAGNVLVFAPRAGVSSELVGDWYGYVTPQHVASLLDARIRDGEQLAALWRGCMGASAEACLACAEACSPPAAAAAAAAAQPAVTTASSCALS